MRCALGSVYAYGMMIGAYDQFGTPQACNEVFGPVMTVLKAEDDEDAVAIVSRQPHISCICPRQQPTSCEPSCAGQVELLARPSSEKEREKHTRSQEVTSSICRWLVAQTSTI